MDLFVVLVLYVVLAVYGPWVGARQAGSGGCPPPNPRPMIRPDRPVRPDRPAKTRLPQRFWHRDRSADPLHQ